MRTAVVVLVVCLIAACPAPTPAPPQAVWRAGVASPSLSQRGPNARGFIDARGLVHSHSIYSHDACDGEPVDVDASKAHDMSLLGVAVSGMEVRDHQCLNDFRRGLCQAQHDFAFLTDHRDAFDDTDYPDALLYRADRGDELVERGGIPTANRMQCPPGTGAGALRPLLMGGNEGALMPVGLEGHAAPTPSERSAIYGARTPEAVQAMHDHGAVVLLAHPEDFSPDELKQLPVDGFEMYNLHANTFTQAGVALELLLRIANTGFDGLPHPDLIFLEIFQEDPRYLQRWGQVLASGKRVVSTMGTDCHRNSFPALLQDGERVDSYRRMMQWFSNHVLVRPKADGTWDDADLKDGLRAGRVYGAFEAIGYPIGFDTYAEPGAEQGAEQGAEVVEIGGTAPVGATLVVKAPVVEHLDPSRTAPRITLRVLQARDDEAGFAEVAADDGRELRVPIDEPGVYRAEVRIAPYHLREDLGDDGYILDERDFVWIYANPITFE